MSDEDDDYLDDQWTKDCPDFEEDPDGGDHEP